MKRSKDRIIQFLVAAAAAQLMVVSSPSAMAREGGDWEVNNGGSLAARVVQLAYYKTERLIYACLAGNPCRLLNREKEILQKIVKALPKQYGAQPKILFESERAKPGFFLIDGEVKAAKTGSVVGAPIYFNKDFLYTRNYNGSVEGIQFGEAIAQLIHELGHHHGNYTHDELDVLGAKVALGTSTLLLSAPILPNSRAVNVQVLNPILEKDYPEVYIQAYDEIVDISQKVKDVLRCPIVSLPLPIRRLPDLDLYAPKANGAKLHNLHWEKFEEDSDKGGRFQIQMSVTTLCKPKNLERFVWKRDTRVNVEFYVQKNPSSSKGWSLRPGSVSVNQSIHAWWKVISIPFF